MKLVKQSAIYLVTEIFKRGMAFLLLPVLTRYMQPEEYGTLSLFTAYIGFATPIVVMSMPLHISRNFFKIDQDQIAEIVLNLNVCLLINTLIALLLITMIGASPYQLFDLKTPWMHVVIAVVAVDALMQFNLIILRNKGQAIGFGVFQAVRIVIDLTVSLALVIAFSMSWQGRVVGVLCGAVTMGFFSLWFLWKKGYVSGQIKRVRIADIYKLSTPMIPHLFAGMMITFSGRFFLDTMEGRAAVGLFAVGYTFASIIASLDQAFILAFSPWLYKSMVDPNPHLKSRMVRYTYFYFAGITAVAIVLGLLGPWLLGMVTTTAYTGANPYIFWISIGFAFQAMYKAITPYFINEGRTSILAGLTVVTAAFCLVFNYSFIRSFGPVGAAYAVALSMFLKLLLVFWYSNRVYPMPWLPGISKAAAQKF